VVSEPQFNTLVAAQAFFSDNTLDLGAVPSSSSLRLGINLDLITNATGSGFGEDFPLGATATVPSTNPVIAAPSSATVGVGQPGPIIPISISETGSNSGEAFTAVLADNSGALAANTNAPGGGGTITSSNGGKTLTIAGTLREVNADLTTLADADPSTAADTITVNAG
jgi:hypothetical protein